MGLSLYQLNQLADARTRLNRTVYNNQNEFYGNVVWRVYPIDYIDQMCCCGHTRREHTEMKLACTHVHGETSGVVKCHCSHFQPLSETVKDDTPKPIGETQ